MVMVKVNFYEINFVNFYEINFVNFYEINFVSFCGIELGKSKVSTALVR